MVESNSKGRRRRDTDSSTKSDKSDISLLSVESGASSASNPTTKKQTGANKANTSAKARTAKGTNAVNAKVVGKKEDEQIAALAGNNVSVVVTKTASKVDNARERAEHRGVIPHHQQR